MTNEKKENNKGIEDFEKSLESLEKNKPSEESIEEKPNEVEDASNDKPNEVTKDDTKPKKEEKNPEPKKEDKQDVKPVHKKSQKEIIEETVEKKFNKTKDDGEIWVTLSDNERNYWNSADEAYFMVTQDRCKPLPEKMTTIIENAVSGDNPLLREATDEEIKRELEIREKERLVGEGKMSRNALKEYEEKEKVF